MAEAEHDTKLEQFCAQEMALFFEHLSNATKKYAESGQVPSSLFGAKNVNRIVKHKRKDSGVKRPLSAYNLFVKEKYEEVKKQSPPGQAPPFKEIFSQVAEMWKKLSPSEKEKYNAKCAALNAAGEEGAAAEPAKEEEHETSEDVPKKKKKKDKHHHHHRHHDSD